MQNVVLRHVVLRACLSNSSPPLRHTAPPQRSSTRGPEPSASARHVATHHAAGRQTQGFLTHTSITPLSHQARASRVWHAKCSAMACPFVCLRFTRHRLSDPLLRPGVERLLRPRVMRRPMMQQARPSDTSKASSHKPPSPLFPTMLQHPESGAKCSAMA
jgi:hypothetical protein